MEYSLPSQTDFSQDQQTSNGEVRIGEHWYPVQGNVSVLDLARYQNKVTFGDPSFDSDPLVSSYIVTSFTGGMGNEFLKSGVEDDTFWDATLETRYPEGPTLLPLTESFTADGETPGAAYPLGDFPAISPTFLAAFGVNLQGWDETGQAFVDLGETLAGVPVYRGVEYEGEFYIPLGPAGFATYDGADVANETDFNAVQFLVWDRKLVALTTSGYVLIQNGDGTWPSPTPNFKVPDGNRARRLVNFIDSQGNPALHIVTDSLVFAFDPDGEELYETRLDYPRHPDQGRGAVNWRGDTMFVSVGTGIHGYNGTNITTMGPDGRYGLPASLRGVIVDLASEYNALLALVQGQAVTADFDMEDYAAIQPPLYQGGYTQTDLSVVGAKSAILRWSNTQWHKVWESYGDGLLPSWMCVSNTLDSYRLWWGYGSRMFTHELPIIFQNPKQSLLAQASRFEPAGELITGWFTADMEAFTKLASHIEVNLEDVTDSNNAGGSVRVFYQLDTQSNWRALGDASTVGLTIMPFGSVAKAVGNPFSQGRPFRRIRFRIVMERDPGNVWVSPLMSSLVFKFHKIPESQLSWSFTIDLSNPAGYKGVGVEELSDYLLAQLVNEEFMEFGYLDQTYRARKAQVAGSNFTGYDNTGMYQVNLVEARLGSLRDPSTVVVYGDMKGG